ncbi:MAG: hypothetical protein PHX80_05660 [Candidatus Nanoarchaeia archaeon]|nr:hypothetical protein [Candidatus Nanoarchaeia archaeon]MDD5546768.1 hypothetical protein [Candidatus Omnitrophota bacterium]
MEKIKLTSEERIIEKDLLAGVYNPVSENEFRAVSEAIAYRKKDALIELRETLIDRKIIAKYEEKERNKKVRFHTAEEILKKQKSA